MSNLKPCPFCGTEPTVKTYPQERWGLRGCVELSCENNYCPVSVVVEENSVEEAAAHWNRRFVAPEVEPTKVDDILKRLGEITEERERLLAKLQSPPPMNSRPEKP